MDMGAKSARSARMPLWFWGMETSCWFPLQAKLFQGMRSGPPCRFWGEGVPPVVGGNQWMVKTDG